VGNIAWATLGTRPSATIIDRHGPASVGIFFGKRLLGMDAAGYRMATALHAALKTPARFQSPDPSMALAKSLVATLVGGLHGLQSAGPDYDPYQTWSSTSAINPMISHGHTVAMPNPRQDDPRDGRRGGEVWVIDPLHTETATLCFASHGGRGRAPITPFLAYLVSRAACRRAPAGKVLARHTQDSDVLRQAVAPFEGELAAPCSRALRLTRLDLLLASVRKAGRLFGRDRHGRDHVGRPQILTQWLAWVLMIITDSMNRPGGALWFHPGFVNRMDAAPLPVMSGHPGAGS